MYHAASFTMTVVKVQSGNSTDGNSKTMPSNIPCCKGVALLNNLGLVFLYMTNMKWSGSSLLAGPHSHGEETVMS